MRKTLMLILISIMIVIILFLTFNLATANKSENDLIELDIVERDEEEKEVVEKIPEIEIKSELLNILLIGVDGEGYGKDKRSDVMIVATVDTDNKALRLTSVARDTLAYLPKSKTYEKINHSYAKGGPENTMLAINTNMDLDIEDYVVFDYKALIKAVDLIGGFPANLTTQEAKDMNIHGDRIQTGEQILSGKDAITYMRIRYNSGGDSGRNQRQRDLIIHIMKEAQEMNKTELLKFATIMLPMVKTSYNLLNIKELLDLYVSIRSGLIMEQYSYPFEFKGGILSDKAWYATPNTIDNNVEQFHKEVLKKERYTPSEMIEEIYYGIRRKSGVE